VNPPLRFLSDFLFGFDDSMSTFWINSPRQRPRENLYNIIIFEVVAKKNWFLDTQPLHRRSPFIMMRSSSVLKKLLASRIQHLKSLRSSSYHASVYLSADALDMTDTFARRHSKFCQSTSLSRKIVAVMTSRDTRA
jgi:hypothetical protein